MKLTGVGKLTAGLLRQWRYHGVTVALKDAQRQFHVRMRESETYRRRTYKVTHLDTQSEWRLDTIDEVRRPIKRWAR